MIGSTGLHTRLGPNAREIGYWIASKYINHGFATESTWALTKVGFEIEQLEKIEIHCSVDNFRSQNIPKKIGYKDVPIVKNDTSPNLNDAKMIWTMSKEDYLQTEIKHFSIKAYDSLGKRLM